MTHLQQHTVQLHKECQNCTPVECNGKSDEWRYQTLKVLKEMFLETPPIDDVAMDFIALLYALPVHDRIYVQRALHPLALKYSKEPYWEKLSLTLQEYDLWIDINVLTDRERIFDQSRQLEISPEFKLP